MDITGAVKRIQKLADLVEKLIQQSNEMRERVIGLEDNAEQTRERIAVVEAKVDRQNALLEALAREEGLEPEDVYAQAGLDEPPEELAAETLEEEIDAEEKVDADEEASDAEDGADGQEIPVEDEGEDAG